MAEREDIEVSNKQIILREYSSGSPKESDMAVRVGTIRLKVPVGSSGVVVKNLYLSCDPYMPILMQKLEEGLADYFQAFTPGSPIAGYGVARVLDSGHPNFNKGDLVWGTTGWEEYSLISQPETLIKIRNTDVPLSYYTGILGKFIEFVFVILRQIQICRSLKHL
ncbi:hypothetical protein U1Q18_024889 [Sarracenia purpurea var. burkii]